MGRQPTTKSALTLDDVDLFSPDTFVQGVPHHYFKLLRREAPVFRHPEPEGPGFWVITKYEDVDHVSMHPETFSSGKCGAFIWDSPPEAAGVLDLMLINQDAPSHTRYRRLVSRAFTPKLVLSLEPHIREVTNGIIDKIAGKGECDFVTDIAADLPLQAIVELMGVPLEDRQKVFDWSNQMIGNEDPEYAPDPEIPIRASMELYAYAQQLADQRRREPKDDIVTGLLQADFDGEALTEADFNSFFMLLSVAGNETTRNAISHGMLALMEHPDQRQRLLDDPSLMRTAVDEILRWASPVMQFRRTAMHDTEIRGVRIKEGDKVVIYYPSANRDEDIFPNADTFDVGRTPNPHVAFGPGGPHFCLGANLARLEVRVMFETLMRRLPDMEIAGPPQYLRSNFIGGIKHLPVTYTPERN
ncbi:MAG: cytochrome P450 [Dehalococcoidia bacterium]